MEENMTDRGADAPTDKQIAAISRLARMTKSSVDMNKVSTRGQASAIIEKLIGKRNGSVRQDPGNDRKCSYGLATKLVHSRHLAVGKNPMGSESFWKEVDEFYRQYLQHMNQAV